MHTRHTQTQRHTDTGTEAHTQTHRRTYAHQSHLSAKAGQGRAGVILGPGGAGYPRAEGAEGVRAARQDPGTQDRGRVGTPDSRSISDSDHPSVIPHGGETSVNRAVGIHPHRPAVPPPEGTDWQPRARSGAEPSWALGLGAGSAL